MNSLSKALLLFLLFSASLTQAQIKNECVGTQADHLAFMETQPGSRALCVDARFLVGCRGPDNGKVTLMYSYEETDSVRSEYISAINVVSKTDGKLKLAPGRWATGKRGDGVYTFLSVAKGRQRGQYIETAETLIDGKKVKALRGGPVRENVWLLDVSEEIASVLRDLRDPCQREKEFQEDVADSERSGELCMLEEVKRSLNRLADFETAVYGFDYERRILYFAFFHHGTKAISLEELAFDKSCMPIKASFKSYNTESGVDEFLKKLDGPTIDKDPEGMARGMKLLWQARK